MEPSTRYAYVDETNINKRLKCIVCVRPFIDPVSIACRHTFCRKCIKKRVDHDPSCPQCKQPSSVDHFMEAPLFLIEMLDELLVSCLECQETGIKRGEFQYHLDEVCPETVVRCLASDIRCPWTGRAHQLQLHVDSCHYEQLRPVLKEMLAENLNEKKKNMKQGIQLQSVEDTATVRALTEEVQFLKNMICHRNPRLEQKLIQYERNAKMDLRRLQLSELDMGILVQQGVIDRQASEIELQQCEINDQALSLLVHALDGNTTLKKLNLGHNPITDVGVALLADLLATNRTALVKLHLVNINITDRGIGYLADMLKHNQTLTALSLFQNRLTDRGVQQLAEALATSNTCLKYLYIQENMEVTDASVDSLINMFQYHQSLEIVDLQKCGLTPSGIRRLRQVANQKENFQLAI